MDLSTQFLQQMLNYVQLDREREGERRVLWGSIGWLRVLISGKLLKGLKVKNPEGLKMSRVYRLFWSHWKCWGMDQVTQENSLVYKAWENIKHISWSEGFYSQGSCTEEPHWPSPKLLLPNRTVFEHSSPLKQGDFTDCVMQQCAVLDGTPSFSHLCGRHLIPSGRLSHNREPYDSESRLHGA